MRILIIIVLCLATVSHAQYGMFGRRFGIGGMLTPFGGLRPYQYRTASRGFGYNRGMMGDRYEPQGPYDREYRGQFNGGMQQFPGRFQQGGYGGYNGYEPMEMAVDTPDYIERRRQRRGQSHLYF